MGVATASDSKPNIHPKRPLRPSPSTRHNFQWPISDASSDITIEVGASSFALHKCPLISRSGRIRKLLLDKKDIKVTRVNIPSIPGGQEAFELAAKFCYGIDIEINITNVAMLRCAAHYLEMTEDFSDNNLEVRTENYLKEKVLDNVSNSISVLHKCESLLPVAEDIGLVSMTINAISINTCKEQLMSGLSKLERDFSMKPGTNSETEDPLSDWWGDSLGVLGLEFFRRVLSSVKSKGLKQDLNCKILMNYAQKHLRGVSVGEKQTASQRVLVETITGLLPPQSRKSSVPMAFLSSLLKHAISLSASISCRTDLERRVGLQLDQAILEDILIPSNPNENDQVPMYDVDSILRIFSIFLNLDNDEGENEDLSYDGETDDDYDCSGSPKQSSILKASKLLDGYLAEVGLDLNLVPSKFIALAELLPDHARNINDGLYRAVDIFLKVHPNMKDSEHYRLCKTIDCEKLSQEACSHAAQNERLPVQMAVQVLYFEQIRLRNALNGNGHGKFLFGSTMSGSQIPHRSGSMVGSGAISPRDNYASVRRENRELKQEVSRMRMRLTDLEKDHVSMKQEMVRTNHPANRILRSLARRFGKINRLFRMRDIRQVGSRPNSESRFMFQKRRRNSVS